MTEPDSEQTSLQAGLPWLVLAPLTLWVTWQVVSGDPDTWASRRFSEEAKVWLAAGGVLLAAGWNSSWFRGSLGPQLRNILLGVLVLYGMGNYARWNPETLGERVDAYDLAHYYLNARYFDELGYEDLYPAMILADHEAGGPHFDEGPIYLAQDARGHFKAPIAHALARGRTVRSESFSDARWQAFTHDSLYIQRELPGWTDRLWRQMIQDHGFNGTPSWVVIAEPLARAVPVESLKWLGLLDVLLMGIALALVAWAWRPTTAAWVLFWLTVSYSMRWPTMSWVFLRYDWVAGLLIAMVCMKKGRPWLGGLAAGWAASLRMFPALWMWGPFCKGLAGLRRGVVHTPLLKLAGGFVLAVALLQVAAVARMGTEPVSVHFHNMMDHNSSEQLSSRRIGLALAIPFRGETLPKYIEPERKAAIERQKPMRYGIALILMGMLGWALRRSPDEEAFAMGFLPFFLLTTASYYYYIARVTLALMHASDLDRTRNRVGLAWLLGLEVFSNWASTAWDGHRVFLVGYLAWGLALYSLVMIGWLSWEAREAETASEPTPAP